MTLKMNPEVPFCNQNEESAILAPSLKHFVQLVKSNLINQTTSSLQTSDMIKSAEKLEKKLSCRSKNAFAVACSCEGGAIQLDPILHHRVMLATGIAKSYAYGNRLSRKRRNILKSNIEYIEKRL